MGAIMTKEQEAQQAQTIAEIKSRFGEMIPTYENEVQSVDAIEIYYDLGTLLEIVDSQAQKIAEQAEKITEIEADCVRYDEAIMIQGKNAGELRRKIAEQAKEIELFREYKEAVETEILIDTKYDAPDESWVDAVGLKINALEQTTDSKGNAL